MKFSSLVEHIFAVKIYFMFLHIHVLFSIHLTSNKMCKMRYRTLLDSSTTFSWDFSSNISFNDDPSSSFMVTINLSSSTFTTVICKHLSAVIASNCSFVSDFQDSGCFSCKLQQMACAGSSRRLGSSSLNLKKQSWRDYFDAEWPYWSSPILRLH